MAGRSTSRPEMVEATLACCFSTATGGTFRPPIGMVLALQVVDAEQAADEMGQRRDHLVELTGQPHLQDRVHVNPVDRGQQDIRGDERALIHLQVAYLHIRGSNAVYRCVGVCSYRRYLLATGNFTCHCGYVLYRRCDSV